MSDDEPLGLDRPFPVLYVDDEVTNQVIFEASFGDDFEIVCASSGQEALGRLAERRFDVLLTDHRMPGMSGAELCEQARELYPEMQRIILTAFTERESMLQAINQGRVSGFLTKPWSADELRRTVHEAQSIAHRSRLASEIASAMQIRNQAEAQRQVLHDLANVASRVAGCCDELESLLPSVIDAVAPPVADHLAEEVRDLRQSVAFLTDLHTSVRGLHVPQASTEESLVLDPLIHGAIAVARAQLPPGTKLDVRCDPSLVVRGDRTDVGRVLVNLIVNAGHAMAEARVPAPRLAVHAEAAGEHVRLSVADNGPGIPEPLRERIFEPRFTTRQHVGGTGLGLAITRRLLEDNGGSITLDAGRDGGAVFVVALPTAGAPLTTA